ncbi:hypothetical protein VF14_16155 [Nostoc linckia z18]|uniref:Uncharacterized protein n=2 Tax=Nostoc linckia TaxID=92942 RepID=A0A9Q6EJ20_NOSLI|nr:hypothetical protein [Nostoc linckia]PHK27925.1 hypothetical protein VF12_33865 [Nostoc linckia z15]PHK43847.1 hypothetical protein VF13_25090 [Nostoc linckia z16]PHJ66101.1 hypothetical protein VF05_19560 [Nostoc linckia z3]PHJ68695.1 hypothetical protein VF02_02130 [Nostoc linckia z1]PHJ74005.1 hypothetical protein VF03_15310 [Nostoc linckia z2]
MGVSVIYSAIPPSSTLYARLQHEKALTILVVSLFSYGCGIYRFFEIEPEEINEILEDAIETHQQTFGSELEAHQVIAQLQSELRRTCQAYPGIEDRTALLEKSSAEIQERLSQELSRRQISNANEIVQKLIFGDRTLAPTLLPPEESLGLISRELVSQGASILGQIDPEALFVRDQSWEGWCLNGLEHWKNLYLSAAENNEEILVGVA